MKLGDITCGVGTFSAGTILEHFYAGEYFEGYIILSWLILLGVLEEYRLWWILYGFGTFSTGTILEHSELEQYWEIVGIF